MYKLYFRDGIGSSLEGLSSSTILFDVLTSRAGAMLSLVDVSSTIDGFADSVPVFFVFSLSACVLRNKGLGRLDRSVPWPFVSALPPVGLMCTGLLPLELSALGIYDYLRY